MAFAAPKRLRPRRRSSLRMSCAVARSCPNQSRHHPRMRVIQYSRALVSECCGLNTSALEYWVARSSRAMTWEGSESALRTAMFDSIVKQPREFVLAAPLSPSFAPVASQRGVGARRIGAKVVSVAMALRTIAQRLGGGPAVGVADRWRWYLTGTFHPPAAINPAARWFPATSLDVRVRARAGRRVAAAPAFARCLAPRGSPPAVAASAGF